MAAGRFCPGCGAEQANRDQFCRSCGRGRTESPPASDRAPAAAGIPLSWVVGLALGVVLVAVVALVASSGGGGGGVPAAATDPPDVREAFEASYRAGIEERFDDVWEAFSPAAQEACDRDVWEYRQETSAAAARRYDVPLDTQGYRNLAVDLRGDEAHLTFAITSQGVAVLTVPASDPDVWVLVDGRWRDHVDSWHRDSCQPADRDAWPNIFVRSFVAPCVDQGLGRAACQCIALRLQADFDFEAIVDANARLMSGASAPDYEAAVQRAAGRCT